jgi:hypothetical protein
MLYPKCVRNYLAFEDLYLWEIMPYNPLKVNWRFGGKRSLYFQDKRIKQTINQHKAVSKQSTASYCVL